jgi:hypothetical protein
MSNPFDVLKEHKLFAPKRKKNAKPTPTPKPQAVESTPDTSDNQTIGVEERKQISREYVVDFQVRCKNFYWHEFTTDDNELIAYWQCGFQVDGGYFNFHIFGRPETKRKDTFRAVMTVWKKKQSDGKTHIYVDMRPTDRPITHRISVWRNAEIMQNTLPEKVQKGAQIFKGQGDNKGCFSLTTP